MLRLSWAGDHVFYMKHQTATQTDMRQMWFEFWCGSFCCTGDWGLGLVSGVLMCDDCLQVLNSVKILEVLTVYFGDLKRIYNGHYFYENAFSEEKGFNNWR